MSSKIIDMRTCVSRRRRGNKAKKKKTKRRESKKAPSQTIRKFILPNLFKMEGNVISSRTRQSFAILLTFSRPLSAV
jgi:hypothetical protein